MAVAIWSSSVAMSGRWWYRALGRTPNWAATARAVTPLNPRVLKHDEGGVHDHRNAQTDPHCGLPI